MKKSIIVLGAGGYAGVLLDILVRQSYHIFGVTSLDPDNTSKYNLFGVPVLGKDDKVLNYGINSICLVNGVGMMPGKNTRCRLYKKFRDFGYTFTRVIHSSAILAANAKLAEGVQVMAGAVIQTGVMIGENTIINTRVAVDHDSNIGKHVHLAPGTTISGDVAIGEGTFVGAGSTIIQGIQISGHCVIAAGSVVTRDVPEGATVMGVPARIKPAPGRN
jgi:sugar O-acyltransferase, sialic acid O-acetyltransferase NeuD family